MRVTFEKKTTAHLTAWITQQQQLDRIRAEAAAAAIEVINQQQMTGVGFLALTHDQWIAAPYNLLGGYAHELVHLKRYVVSTLFILGGDFSVRYLTSLSRFAAFWLYTAGICFAECTGDLEFRLGGPATSCYIHSPPHLLLLGNRCLLVARESQIFPGIVRKDIRLNEFHFGAQCNKFLIIGINHIAIYFRELINKLHCFILIYVN